MNSEEDCDHDMARTAPLAEDIGPGGDPVCTAGRPRLAVLSELRERTLRSRGDLRSYEPGIPHRSDEDAGEFWGLYLGDRRHGVRACVADDEGDPLFDRGDAFVNADHRAAFALADPDFVSSLVGVEVEGRVYEIPPFIPALVKRYLDDYSSVYTCNVMPYIVTLTPPPVKPGQ